MQVTFQDVHHYGAISQITDTYYINHFPEILDMYDGNFLTFRINPDLPTLKAAEEALRRFHQQNQQDHLKFVFPVDTQLKSDCRNYLETQGYSFSVTELYQITPKDFRGKLPKISRCNGLINRIKLTFCENFIKKRCLLVPVLPSVKEIW